MRQNVTDAGAHTTLHDLTTTTVSDEHRITRATLLLNAGASLCKRDQLLKSTPVGWACRRGRLGFVDLYLARAATHAIGCRAMGDSIGVGHEVRALGDCEAGAFGWRDVKVQIPSPVAFATNDRI